jgi:hypothetical protein
LSGQFFVPFKIHLGDLVMAKRRDLRKRREWEERCARFRAGGISVVRFCANEGVSESSFYYWMKRVGSPSAVTHSTATRSTSQDVAREESDARRRVAAASMTSDDARILFRLGGAVEVSVPADCWEVIRGLLQFVEGARAARPQAFQEVVVAPR